MADTYFSLSAAQGCRASGIALSERITDRLDNNAQAPYTRRIERNYAKVMVYLDPDHRMVQPWAIGSPIAIEQDLDQHRPVYHVHWATLTMPAPADTVHGQGYYFSDPHLTAARIGPTMRRPLTGAVCMLGVLIGLEAILDAPEIHIAIAIVQVAGLAPVRELYLGHVADTMCAQATARFGSGDNAREADLGMVFRRTIGNPGAGMRMVWLQHDWGKSLYGGHRDEVDDSRGDDDDARSYAGSEAFV